MVAANDFRRQWDEVKLEALAAVDRVGASGWYVLGQEVAKFEAELASLWGLDHAVGVANGTDAIEIALRALGCQPGDRVLTTPISAFATTLAIVKIGAIPVFADVDDRGLIDLDRCREILREREDIHYFVPVHLYGHVLDLSVLRRLRDQFDLRIVEDCAQAAGAKFHGESAGSAGQIATTSFYPTKNLGAMGDGGAVLTNDPQLAQRVRVLRSYGETEKYHHEEIGFNSRLDEVQAAILRDAALPRLKRWVQRRRQIAQTYLSQMRHPEVAPSRAFSESSWHLFPVFVEPKHRQHFMEHLKSRNIAVGVHYPIAIPDQPVMAKTTLEMANRCTTARRICKSEVSLPIHPYLTDEEVQQVVDAVNSWKAPAAEPVQVRVMKPAAFTAAQGAPGLARQISRFARIRFLLDVSKRWRQPLQA